MQPPPTLSAIMQPHDLHRATEDAGHHLVDSDEPGQNDRFELLIANGYSAGSGQTLDGGNVQIH